MLPPINSGNIVGFSGNEWLSSLINLATYGLPWWNLSHVGIIAPVQRRFLFGNIYCHDSELDQEVNLIFESTTNCNIPCVIQGKIANGVQAHFPYDRIVSYSGKVWVYPLVVPLRPLASARLGHFLLDQIGKEYDEIGAFRAGGVGFSLIESLLRKEDLSSIFCSELCAAAHRHIKIFDTDNVSKWNPNHFVRAERRGNVLGKPVRVY